MGRSRDHKAEYARRIANAAAKGLTRSQARGHARTGEVSARPGKGVSPDPRLEAALRELRKSGNRGAAAKSVNIAPERFRRFLRENVEIEGRGKSLRITDHRSRDMKVFTGGKVRVLRLRDFEQASLNGRHRSAIAEFLRTNDRDLLRPFDGATVIDLKGRAHPLETDPNVLHRIASADDGVFHEIYRLNS